MSRVLAAALVLIIGLSAAPPASAAPPVTAAPPSEPGGAVATTPPDAEIVEGRVIVGWRDATKASNVAQQRGLAIVAGMEHPGKGAPSLLSTRGRPLGDVLAELRADPAVAYAEPDYRVHLTAVTVNDPKTADQYSLDAMRVRDAWSLTTGGSGVVAVLDTGVQADHPDLKGRVLAGYDFVNGDSNAADDNGHGTWVAGIIAARANDAYGVAGISWSDKILPVKIMNSGGTGTTYDLARGITWAADNGATIINMSVGGFPYLQSVQDAVNAAWAKGIVLIGAAGNNNREERFYPASYTNVVSVSATQVNDEFSHWSSYGPSVDVSAPGSSVLTTNCIATICPHPDWGTHTYISGTSFATPNVAGVVALLRAAFPSEGPAEIVARLIGSVDDLGAAGWDNRYGHGRVNTYRALGGSVAAPVRLAGDALEGNATLAAARRVAIGATVSPTIWPAGDVDWFYVDAPRMGRLDVRVTGVTDTRPYPWHKSSLPIDPVIELYDAGGAFLKRVDAVWESGIELAQISVSAATRVHIRVSNYYANGNRAAYTLAPSFVDEVPPRVTALTPAPGGTMVSPHADVTFTFSEPVTGVSSATVSLRRPDGSLIPASLSHVASTGRVTLVPSAPLPSDTTIRLRLTTGIVDAAGLPLTATSYTFKTMPGTTLSETTRVRLSAGTHIGHRMGANGAILGLKPVALAAASGANVTQRAELPGLPGRWLYVSNGVFAGTWIRESARASVGGSVELVPLPPTTRLTYLSGSHSGLHYDTLGAVIGRKTATLRRASGSNVDQLAIINGQRHYRVTNGTWAGYWMPESARAHRAGIVDRMAISRRVQIVAGTHTGVAFSTSGERLGTRVARLDGTSGANATAWAMIHGRPHVLIANGIWAGYWLPEHAVSAYER